jgi:hypothetical protein
MTATTVVQSDVVFCPNDYSDPASLRKAFSAVYAEFLRHPQHELVVDGGSPEQQAVIASVKASRSSDARRGKRSFIPEVNTRGKACSLKRHFGTGCMRQIIGYAEKLAAQDPERFIWVREWQKTAKRGRNGDSGVYSATQIKRSVWALEAGQLLIAARRSRNGRMRTGWIVAKHDDVATITGRKCRLLASPKFTISPRSRGQQLERYIGDEIDGRGTIQGTLESTPRDYQRDYQRDFEIDPEGLSNDGKQLEANEIQDRGAEIASPNPVNPVNPVIKEPSYPTDWDWRSEPTATPTSSFVTRVTRGTREEREEKNSIPTSSKTKTSPTQPVQVLETITPAREFKTWQPPPQSEDAAKRDRLHDCVQKISSGAFDTKFLSRYEHPQELLRCCAQALAESIGNPWRDPAHGMARAMDLMRQLYGLNVPKGWLPVMYDLRIKNKASQNQAAAAATADAYDEPLY